MLKMEVPTGNMCITFNNEHVDIYKEEVATNIQIEFGHPYTYKVKGKINWIKVDTEFRWMVNEHFAGHDVDTTGRYNEQLLLLSVLCSRLRRELQCSES